MASEIYKYFSFRWFREGRRRSLYVSFDVSSSYFDLNLIGKREIKIMTSDGV